MLAIVHVRGVASISYMAARVGAKVAVAVDVVCASAHVAAA